MSVEYSDNDRAQALTELALTGGDVAAAIRRLKPQDRFGSLSRKTLEGWRDRHPEVYARVAADLTPQIESMVAAENTDLVRRMNLVISAAVKQLETAIKNEEIEAKSLPALIRDTSAAQAKIFDRARVIRGQPTDIIEERNPAEILRALAQRAPQVIQPIIEGTATPLENLALVPKPGAPTGSQWDVGLLPSPRPSERKKPPSPSSKREPRQGDAQPPALPAKPQ